MADQYEEALAKAKQLALKYGCESAASATTPNNNNTGTKRSAEDDSEYNGSGKRHVNDALAAAAEAAARINQKIGSSGTPNPFSGPYNNSSVKTVSYSVPDNMVGLIIGKKGEQIVRIQSETGCKVQITLESNGTPERPCTLIGTDEQIDAVKKIFDEIVGKASMTAGAGGGNFVPHGQMQTIEISVPGTKAGLIIGKNGDTIKSLMEQYGVKMVLVQDNNMPTHLDKPLRISGDPERVEKVKAVVIDLLNARATVGPTGVAHAGGEAASTFAVPSDKAGLVIGRGGETIKEIMSTTGAFVAISKAPAPDPSIKIFNISGTASQIEIATKLICEKAGIPMPASMDNNGSSMSSVGGSYSAYGGGGGASAATGAYGASYGQWNAGGATATAAASTQNAAMPAPTVNAQTGQLDYSAAWIQYYRAKGMHEAADKIQAQFPAAARTPAVPAQSAQNYGYPQQSQAAPSSYGQPNAQWTPQGGQYAYPGWNGAPRTG